MYPGAIKNDEEHTGTWCPINLCQSTVRTREPAPCMNLALLLEKKKGSHLSSWRVLTPAPIVNAALNNSDYKEKETLLSLLIIISFLSYTIYSSVI